MTKCEHPGCDEESIGASINGREICLNHIEWAMGRAFEPIRQMEEFFKEDDDPDG